jgi:hypothetical protein
LRELASLPEDHDDAALLVEGRRCYFGTTPIHRSTFNALIRVTALSKAYDDGPYWIINGTGRAIARRPELAAEVVCDLHAGTRRFLDHRRSSGSVGLIEKGRRDRSRRPLFSLCR